MSLALMIVVDLVLGSTARIESGNESPAVRLQSLPEGSCLVRTPSHTWSAKPLCGLLVRADRQPNCTEHWTCALNTFERKIYSQQGEDGILLELLRRFDLNRPGQTFVEFGVEDGRECNTRILRDRAEWSGFIMDGGHANANINLFREYIEPATICAKLALHGARRGLGNLTLLVVDIDSFDWFILRALFECDFRPLLVIIEYNSIWGPYSSWTQPPAIRDFGFDYFGASLQALARLAYRYGYRVLATDTRGVNAFFAHESLLDHHARTLKRKEYVEWVAARWHKPNYGGQPERSLHQTANDANAIRSPLSMRYQGHRHDTLARPALEVEMDFEYE